MSTPHPVAAGHGGAGGTSPPPAHSALASLGAQFVGVMIMAVLAGFDDRIGRIMVVIMAGFLLLWLLTNATLLQTLVGKL